MARPTNLRACTSCGWHGDQHLQRNGNSHCGRAIDPRDQSVLPIVDSGFRINSPQTLVSVVHNFERKTFAIRE